MEHYKWATMKSNDIARCCFVLELLDARNIKYFEGSIDETATGNKVLDVLVIEFDATPAAVKSLMDAGNLKLIRGYLI